jgi:hypothetical protein
MLTFFEQVDVTCGEGLGRSQGGPHVVALDWGPFQRSCDSESPFAMDTLSKPASSWLNPRSTLPIMMSNVEDIFAPISHNPPPDAFKKHGDHPVPRQGLVGPLRSVVSSAMILKSSPAWRYTDSNEHLL